jgi:DNA invertase Pin-like site-specific DNA recombinase
MLDRDDLAGTRVVALCRVSDPYNNDGASLNRQKSSLHDEIKELVENHGGELVESYKVGESGSTMDRECLNEILDMVENDEFDVLMVWALHRLSRANPWDTFDYLLKLREHGIIVYSDRDGYFDWDDPGDAALMTSRVTTSREWRNEIERGARENNREYLRKGQWPYGPTPYGIFKKDLPDHKVDDGNDLGHELVVKPGYEWIHEEIFQRFLAGEDPDEISESIKIQAGKRNVEINAPTENQVENLLDCELLTGRLILARTGEVVRTKEDLRCISKETFDEVQEIRSTDDSHESLDIDPQDLPDFVYELIARFGQEFVVENIEGIRWCCPECKSTDLKVYDDDFEYWGIHLPHFYCNECEYNGASIRLHDLEEIDTTFPLICPDCQRTDHFSVETIEISIQGDWLYKFTCKHCGGIMIKNKHPHETIRALDESTNELSLKDSDEPVRPESDETGEINTDLTLPEVPTSNVYDALADWFELYGPESENAQKVMIDTMKLLEDEGPLKWAELREYLLPNHEGRYASFNAMMTATLQRHYASIPGLTKPSRGVYNFDSSRIDYLLAWKYYEINDSI